MSAVQIDVHLHVGDINTIKNNAAAGGIFHTVQAPQEGTFSGTRRSEHCNDITFVDRDIDPLEDLELSEALPKINYVYHSSSGSFPKFLPAG